MIFVDFIINEHACISLFVGEAPNDHKLYTFVATISFMAEMPGFGVMYLVMFLWEIIYLLTSVLNQNDDAGEYKCVATNDAGSSEGIAYLTVKGEKLSQCLLVLF